MNSRSLTMAVNELLVKLFHDIMTIEEKAIITEEFKDITNNDMHVIEAIGNAQPVMVSAVARTLSVTQATVNISMNGLEKKGYINRERSTEDKRVVFVTLTEKGKKAYNHHRDFHKKMIHSIVDNMDDSEKEVMMKFLNNLIGFFDSYR
ncbi:MAG: MarR family transcriptional regulator [Lachnospiraceae bacterium]|nr:MarR family transcriptional regulator [Lachnospiraceae bacterium]